MDSRRFSPGGWPKKLRLARESGSWHFHPMDERIADDARFADRAKVRQARMMTEEERVLAGPRLFAGVCERMKEGIRDEEPGVTEDEVHRLLLHRLRLLGKLEARTAIP